MSNDNPMKIALLSLILCLASIPLIAQKTEIKLAQSHLAQREYSKAESLITSAINSKKGKTDKDAWAMRGYIYSTIAGEKLDPEAVETAYYSYIQAEAFGKKDEFDDQLLKLAETALIVGYTEERNGNYRQAIDVYQVGEGCVMETNASEGQFKFRLAQCYFMISTYDKSIGYYERCIENNYRLSEAYEGLDNNYQISSDYSIEMRITNIEEALSKLPENERILSIASDVYAKATDFMKAEEVSNKMIELYPESPSSYVASGNAMYDAYIYMQETGDSEQSQEYYKKAEKSYEKANELYPNHKIIELSLGTLYYQRALQFEKEMNELGFSDEDKKKHDELTKESHAYLKKALPYLQSAYSHSSDDDTTLFNALKHIYLTLEMEEDYEILMAD